MDSYKICLSWRASNLIVLTINSDSLCICIFICLNQYYKFGFRKVAKSRLRYIVCTFTVHHWTFYFNIFQLIYFSNLFPCTRDCSVMFLVPFLWIWRPGLFSLAIDMQISAFVQTVNSQKTSRCGVWSQVQNEAFFLRFMFRDSLLYRCLVVFLSMFLKRLNSIISVRKLKNHSDIGESL